MKSDLYLKSILTIIAICLVINIIKDFDFIPKAYAGETNQIIENKLNLLPGKNYGLIPVNADGSINVNIKSSGTMGVSIERISNYVTVPVLIKENRDK